MSYDKEKLPIVSDKYKFITCQVAECLYNTRPGCNHEWIELDAGGSCIFRTLEPIDKVVKHPITGSKFTVSVPANKPVEPTAEAAPICDCEDGVYPGSITYCVACGKDI